MQLEVVTQVTVTNANARAELHGKEHVRAIDLRFVLVGSNELLDLIEPGLRAMHYWNPAAEAGQEALPDMVIPLPTLRFPKLPRKYRYDEGKKYRGFRFIRDYGLDERSVDFTDCSFGNIEYEVLDGGTCKIWATVSYNGDELQNNDLYGELSGLASEGDIHIQLIAPAELVAVKKGYRAGKPDTPAGGETVEGQGELDAEEEDTPEAALERAAAAESAA